MFKEHDVVALTEHIPSRDLFDVDDRGPLFRDGNSGEGLIPGDVGTIIHVYPRREAFIVEFTASGGRTVTLADVLPSQARPATEEDLANARFRKMRRTGTVPV